MINIAARYAGLGVLLGTAAFILTGTWVPLGVTTVGFLSTWLFTSGLPVLVIHEDKIRTYAVRETEKWLRLRPCYDYGGCKWRGDGCAGRPLVLGPGVGCVHMTRKRYLDQCEVCVRPGQFCRCDQGKHDC